MESVTAPWIWPTVAGVAIAVVGFFSAMLLRHDKQLGAAKQRSDDKDRQCAERLAWMRNMDEKLDDIADKTSWMYGKMGGKRRS